MPAGVKLFTRDDILRVTGKILIRILKPHHNLSLLNQPFSIVRLFRLTSTPARCHL